MSNDPKWNPKVVLGSIVYEAPDPVASVWAAQGVPGETVHAPRGSSDVTYIFDNGKTGPRKLTKPTIYGFVAYTILLVADTISTWWALSHNPGLMEGNGYNRFVFEHLGHYGYLASVFTGLIPIALMVGIFVLVARHVHRIDRKGKATDRLVRFWLPVCIWLFVLYRFSVILSNLGVPGFRALRAGL